MRLLVDALHSKEGGGRSYIQSQLDAWCKLPEATLDEIVVLTEDAHLTQLDHPQLRWIAKRRIPATVRFVKTQASLRTVVREEHVEAVYCPGNFGTIWQIGVPVVVALQNPHYFTQQRFRFSGRIAVRTAVESALSKLTLRNCSLLVAISDSLASEGARQLKGRCPVKVITSGSPDLPMNVPAFRLPLLQYLLTVSNFYEHKAIGELLEACAIAFPPASLRPPLVIVGNPVHTRALNDFAAAAERTGYPIWWLKGIARPELFSLYREATLFVSASHAEAYPLTPEEADVMGTPAVLSDLQAHREVLPTATFFPVGNVLAAGSVIREAFHDALSRPTPERAETRPKWTWTDNARELRNCIESVIGKATVGPGDSRPHR